MQHQVAFGRGASDTLLHPLVAVAMVVAIVLILLLPRKYAALPFVFLIFTAPMGQQLVVGSLHLFVPRVLIIFGWMRVIFTKISSQEELFPNGLNPIDRAFFWVVVCETSAMLLLYHELPPMIYQFGLVMETLGGYFLLRFFIRDEQDIYRVLKCLALVTVVVSVGMVIEQRTLKNIFGMLGGVNLVPDVREGRIRSQGPFEHELLAGTFGATLMPLFYLLWKNGNAKVVALIGMISATIMTITSNSSTSLLGYAAGVLGICLWPMRKSMRMVRWGIVFALVGLQAVMKQPVWFAIAHVSLVGGSSSWHRAAIIDAFIRHFWDWWLVGTKDTGSWGFSMWDSQNEFVTVGQSGGLAALIFFIVMISRAFGRLGSTRKAIDGDKKQEWFLWLLGATLFAHIVSFFGVNYFDQTKYLWFVLLVMISTTTAALLQTSTVPNVTPQVAPVVVRNWAYSVANRTSESNTASRRQDPAVKRAR